MYLFVYVLSHTDCCEATLIYEPRPVHIPKKFYPWRRATKSESHLVHYITRNLSSAILANQRAWITILILHRNLIGPYVWNVWKPCLEMSANVNIG